MSTFKSRVDLMMPRAYSAISFVLILILLSLASAPRVERASCLPLDEDVAAFETHAEELATSSDSVYVATREQYGLLAVPESEVERITDQQLCSDAAKAYKQVVGLQGQAPSVHVVRVGTRYIVYNPDVKGGEWVVFVVFDDQFNELAVFAG